MSNISEYGVTLRRNKRQDESQESPKYYSQQNSLNSKGWREEKKRVSTEKGIELKAPKHREVAIENKIKKDLKNTLRCPQYQNIAPNREPISVLKTAIKFAEPIAPIIGEMMGLQEPALITKEVLNSLENSIEVYEETNDIDEAIISGVKSFVVNYTKEKMESYLENVVSINNNESDNEFKVAVRGSILMTSLYSIMENVKVS